MQVLERNFAALVMNQMLEKGEPRENVEAELRGLLSALSMIESGEIVTARPSGQEISLGIRLSLGDGQ